MDIDSKRDKHQVRLMEAASQMGIEFRDLSGKWKFDAVEYLHGKASVLILEGRSFPWLTVNTLEICENRHVSKVMLDSLGIPRLESRSFRVPADLAVSEDLREFVGDFLIPGKQYTCRPVKADGRQAVGSSIRDLADLEFHVDAFCNRYQDWILESQVAGEELSLLVLGTEIVSAAISKPFGLVGDGTHTLEELIETHNHNAGAEVLSINAEVRQCMREQDVYLSSVIEDGRKIRMGASGHVSDGEKTDIKASIHPKYQEWAEAIATRTGAEIFELKLQSIDVESDPGTAAVMTDIVTRPRWLNYSDADLQGTMAHMILEKLFPSLKSAIS